MSLRPDGEYGVKVLTVPPVHCTEQQTAEMLANVYETFSGGYFFKVYGSATFLWWEKLLVVP